MVMRSSDFLSSSTVFVFVHPSATAVSNVVLTKSDDDAATVATCGVSTVCDFRDAASASTRALSFALYFKLRGLVLNR